MTLRVVGAGLGRTGTLSLKHALERLLGGRCYHMLEVFQHPDDVARWRAALRGEPDWPALLGDCVACVDWPAAAFWPELARAYPGALVLLSVRHARSWWESADATILPHIRRRPDGGPPFVAEWHEMVRELMARRFDGDLDDAASAMAAFERHNERVRREVPPARLLEWRAGDGWEPLCAALGVPVPDEPFPRANSREEFLARQESQEHQENG